MSSTRTGLSLIKYYEQCRLTAYQDAVGIWTIGWGDTSNVHPGMTISQREADARLLAKYDDFEHFILVTVSVPLNDNQLGALVCFTYNVGKGAFQSSTLLKKIDSHDPTAVNEFSKWNKAGGQILPGLVKRRTSEAKLFSTPT